MQLRSRLRRDLRRRGGASLDGSKRYRLTFPTPPPVGAFWSVTMYDTPDFFLVANQSTASGWRERSHVTPKGCGSAGDSCRSPEGSLA
jgi:hypothetical protein